MNEKFSLNFVFTVRRTFCASFEFHSSLAREQNQNIDRCKKEMISMLLFIFCHFSLLSLFAFEKVFVSSSWANVNNRKTEINIWRLKNSYLASVGLYVTSYLSTGGVCWSIDVCHDILTEAGVKNVTVIFSGAEEIETETKEQKSAEIRWRKAKAKEGEDSMKKFSSIDLMRQTKVE